MTRQDLAQLAGDLILVALIFAALFLSWGL